MIYWPVNDLDMVSRQIRKALYAEFVIGSTRIAAGDTFDCAELSTNVNLMVHMSSKEEAQHTISVLAESETILSPLEPHPKPDDNGCGSVTKDRFGYT